MRTAPIGFIGLGIMGKPMANNLLKAGHTLVVHNRSRPAVDELVAAGAKAAASPGAVAAECPTIITMLPDSPDVEKVVAGPDGILSAARKDTVIVDMSSISPLVSRSLAKLAEAKGIVMLDAPVSGGEPKAIDGTLAVMVGGPLEVLDKVREILSVMAASVVHVGDSGSGQVAKLANQMIVGLNIAALSEAMVLATKAGVEPEKVFEAIQSGLAGSTVMKMKMPMILDGNFKPGFRIELHVKDLKNALATAGSMGVPAEQTARVCEAMQELVDSGKGGDDHAGLVQFFEKNAEVLVRRHRGPSEAG